MPKFFSMRAGIIASIFAIFFAFTTILALFMEIINQQIFNANLYKNILVELNIYERLPEIVGIALTDNFSRTVRTGGEGGMPLFMQNLTATDWQAILTDLLPADNLRIMTESTLDQMAAYLDGRTNTVTVPLDKLKERFSGQAGADLFMQMLNSKPACTAQDLAQMVSGPIYSDTVLVLCKPPEEMLPIVALVLPELLKSMVPQIPDKAIILKPPALGVPPSGSGPFGADPISTIRKMRLIMRLSPLLPLTFLLFVTLFAVRSLKSWLRWWGIPIFISGAISLGLGILALPATNTVWAMFIVPRIPPLIPADIAVIGQELLRSFVHSITNGIALWAIIFLVLGLAGWISSYFIKTKMV
jgi:hypothetical protein